MGYRRLALGLAGGYLAGRYKKTRWLLAVAALVATKRLGGAAVQRGSEAAQSSPELRKLADQGKETAIALLGNQIRGLSSRIHSVTESVRQTSEPSPNGQPEGEEQARREQESPNGGDQQDQPAQSRQQNQGEQQEAQTQQEDQQQPQNQQQEQGGQESAGEGKSPSGESAQSSRSGPGQRAQVTGRPDSLSSARRRR